MHHCTDPYKAQYDLRRCNEIVECEEFCCDQSSVVIALVVVVMLLVLFSRASQGKSCSVDIKCPSGTVIHRCVTNGKLKVRTLVEFDVKILSCKIVDTNCSPPECACAEVSKEGLIIVGDLLKPDSMSVENGEAKCHKQLKCFVTQQISITLAITYILRVKSCKVISDNKHVFECELPVDSCGPCIRL